MPANGALLGLIVNDIVPAHVVQSVFNMLITAIGHLFGRHAAPLQVVPDASSHLGSHSRR
jgi:hypothetical protein